MSEELRTARRAYSPKEKLEILFEGVATGNVAEVCRRRGVTVNLYYNWRARLFKDIGQVFAHSNGGVGRCQTTALEERLRRKDAVIAELIQENLDLKRGRWH
jgi:transposase-like protein